MALTATLFRFELNLSDVDRGVYETIELRVAQHPSETDAYLVTRMLAYALEYERGLSFGRGVSTPEDPPISAPDQMGGFAIWVEIGQPSAERLHKITKQAQRVCVYTHKNPEFILADLKAGSIHRAEEIDLFSFDPSFIDTLAAQLTRNNTWDILRTEGALYVTIGEQTHSCTPGVHTEHKADAHP